MSRNKFALVCVVFLVCAALVTLSNLEPVVARTQPHLGPVFLGPEFGDWNEYQRPLFRASGFDLAKVHIGPGYNTFPQHVEGLIEDGAQMVVFKTDDCRIDTETIYNHLVGRGFLDVIDRHPHVDFAIQVGNEPERCSGSMDSYLTGLFEVATTLRPDIDRENLEWIAGLPMSPETARDLLDQGALLDFYDGVGTNMLGHYSLTEERHGWHEIVDHVVGETDADLWITEIGINHPPMDKSLKAERILDYIDQLPAERVRGVAIFALAQGSDWPQYEYAESMVPVVTNRESCRFFVATEQWLCNGFKSYWEEYGGLPVFGYPISGEFRDDNGRNVQYFERARLEWHPGVWPEQHDVLLGHLGREVSVELEEKAEFQSSRPRGECRYFPETRQNLCDPFLDYWSDFGGLPIFGYPISQPHEFNGHSVQYFERTRLEYHPGAWPERYDVLQGHLGREVFETISPEFPERPE